MKTLSLDLTPEEAIDWCLQPLTRDSPYLTKIRMMGFLVESLCEVERLRKENGRMRDALTKIAADKELK